MTHHTTSISELSTDTILPDEMWGPTQNERFTLLHRMSSAKVWESHATFTGSVRDAREWAASCLEQTPQLGLGDVMVLMYTPGEQICVARWKDGVSLPDGKF